MRCFHVCAHGHPGLRYVKQPFLWQEGEVERLHSEETEAVR